MWDKTDLLRKRLIINQKCETDLSFRAAVLNKCKNDPDGAIFWCNNFAWTFDPRTPTKNLPFILFPKQIEFIKWVETLMAEKQDGICEKSRDMGVSYTTLIPVVLYNWLFKEFSAKVGSRKEDYVDTPGDMDSLFEKIVYNLKRMPKWMLPDGFNVENHKTYMKLTRPDNTNTITGESANDSFSRGGRQNLVLFDEFGFWPSARASWESAGETTPTRLAVSTPPVTGRSSHMYKLASGQMGRVSKFMFHFKDDPRKGEAEIAALREKKSQEEFEREMNISYEGSTEGTVYAAQFNMCDFGEYDYKPELPLYVCWDFGLDAVAMQWWQWDHKVDRWYLIDSYENNGKDIKFYIPFITGIVTSDKGYDYSKSDFEKIKRHLNWRKDAAHFGDPSVNQHNVQSGKSTADILRENGIIVQSKAWAGRSSYDLKQVTLLFMKKIAIDTRYNEFFSDCIRNARYPKRGDTSQSTSEINKPIHDWTSHHRSTLEYMADNAPTKYVNRDRSPERDREEERRREYARKHRNPITGY